MRNLPEKVDISFFHDLPLNIRQRVLQEGKIVYTKDDYYVYTLVKETDFEMSKYSKMQEEYHKEVMKRVQKRLSERYVDIERLREKIDELESYLQELDMLLPEYERAYLDLRTKRACEKTVALACETVIDICNSYISKRIWQTS